MSSIIISINLSFSSQLFEFRRGDFCGVGANMLDCDIVVSEFKFQLHYYIHFRANTLGKGMNPLILPAMD